MCAVSLPQARLHDPLVVQQISAARAAEMQACRASCENCGFTSAQTLGGVPALILDEPSDDLDADPADRRLIRLDDRRGRETIARHGHSFLSATISGRYLRVFEVFCRGCGHLYQIRTLAPALAQFAVAVWSLLAIPFGMLFYALSPGILTGIFNAMFFGSSAAGAALGLIDPVIRLWLRFRYPVRAREFCLPAVCPECGSKASFNPATLFLASQSQTRSSQLPCPACRRISLVVRQIAPNNPTESA